MKSWILIFVLTIMLGQVNGQRQLTQVLAKQVLLDTNYTLSPGVQERDLLYLDRGGKKVSVKIIEAKLNRRRLVMEAATPSNQDIFGRQTLVEEMKWESKPGHQPVAGINADFFNMKNGTPLGVVVKESRVLKGHFTRTNCFVGVLKNGRIIMGDSLLFKKQHSRLTEALGARPRLIEDGKIIHQDTGSLSKIHHPRSALGLKNSRTVLFVTVDGRQPAISNGISLKDLATLMDWLGARDAVNLDGGGSTTLVVLDPVTKRLEVRNQPSGKVQRKVANAWILLRKK
ncbi:MAG TPA: phosphodiester glycosidase family protein [Arachidicoccus sp.]|nr:phosphodiester glycosidase family protein [Arachidicoccus sp.]